MAEHTMETMWRTALWRQFGAAIAMLENALVACPASLWTERLWSDPPPPEFPRQFAEFWYVAFHALVWLDLYLSGVPARRVSVVRGAATQLSRVAPLQSASRAGTCGPTEPLSRTARHPGRGARLGRAREG